MPYSTRVCARIAGTFLFLFTTVTSDASYANPPDKLAHPKEVSKVEMANRQAAVGYVMPSVIALGVLRLECRSLLANTTYDVDKLALRWWQRNRMDIDAATWVIADSINHNTETLTQGAAIASDKAIVEVILTTARTILQVGFGREVPTFARCRNFVQVYATTKNDLASLARQPGMHDEAAYLKALRGVLRDPAYRVPDAKQRVFDVQVGDYSQPLISMDALDAARESGDTRAVDAILASMKSRGLLGS